MPGLNQLKQFNSDLLNLGDEVKIRSARGEKPTIVPIPKNVEDRDDSEDFRNGMPELSEDEQAKADAALLEAEKAKNDFSDITGESDDVEEVEQEEARLQAPDVSNLLGPADIDIDDIDLSDFEEPAPPPPKKETPIEDLDLDDLLGLKDETPEQTIEEVLNYNKPNPPNMADTVDVDIDTLTEIEPEEIEEIEEVQDVLDEDVPEIEEVNEAGSSKPDGLDDVFAADDLLGGIESLGDDLDTSINEPLENPSQDVSDFNFDNFSPDSSSFDMGSEDSLGISNDVADDLGNIDFNENEISDISPDLTSENNLQDDFENINSQEVVEPNIQEADSFEMPEMSDMPEMPEMAENQGETESFDMPEMPDMSFDSETSDKADVSSEFDAPNDSETSESSESFENQDMIDMPEMADSEVKEEPSDSFEMPEMSDMPEMSEMAENQGETESFDMPEMPDMSFDSETSDEADVSSEFDAPNDSETSESSESSEAEENFDYNTPSEVLDLGDFNPGSGNEESGGELEFSMSENNDSIDMTPSETPSSEGDSNEFSMEDFGVSNDSLPSDSGDGIVEEGEAQIETPGLTDDFSFDLPDMDGPSGDSDFSLPDYDFNSPIVPGEGISPDMEVPDSEDEESFETFDTSDINDYDFSTDEATDFELGNITTQEADEDDLFSIPGFSDTVTADLNKNRAPEVQTPDFSDAIEDESGRVKNTFTDNEYKRFQQNLETYPLNIRIAIEDLVVKNEFTDDAVFGILEKVYRKAPARQIASELEKMLDVSLDVPRDFERRTVQEYEAYKKSLEYQLRNRILPAAILSTGAAIFTACLFLLIRTFIVFPVKASNLYKQGYVLLENNQYDQALDCFNEAVIYKDVKEWYYKYANGFREKKQYDRATSMYKAILAFFNHEKRAGMEWADMESSELYNYEETERILKREVLDYHINDLDAITLLGDLYLDWATEKDSSKFPMAKAEYDLLLELGSAANQNKYLSRQMRYYIRTDNLRQVLGYKEYFFDIKGKNGLGAADLTELSGYLLDKLYGTLTPVEESLRFNIENVRELLERAIKADPSNPVALYNMGRYFVQTKNRSAGSLLKSSIDKFNAQSKRTRSETYKYINCYRLLGEEYRDQREYFLAEETYGNGLTLFEKENDESGFVSDANIGKLYADMADLDYFIFGDMDHALTNYENSIMNKNDTSSIRYRIGYIQYKNENYEDALNSFIRSSEVASNDTHLLLALGNTLNIRGDNYASQGYYERLLSIINGERELHEVILPQVRSDHSDLVDVYMKVNNNLGVTYARLASATGNSSLNGKSLTCLQESIRAWDAMTRNQDTMIRLEGSNLAAQNVKYITNSTTSYAPEIYTDIFKLMDDEEGIK